MKRIRINKNKLAIAVCIVIPAATVAVLIPRAVKNAKHSKSVCA